MSCACKGKEGILNCLLPNFLIIITKKNYVGSPIFLAQVILTDGDLLTLANMKHNLERNRLNYDDELLKEAGEAQSTVSMK